MKKAEISAREVGRVARLLERITKNVYIAGRCGGSTYYSSCIPEYAAKSFHLAVAFLAVDELMDIVGSRLKTKKVLKKAFEEVGIVVVGWYHGDSLRLDRQSHGKEKEERKGLLIDFLVEETQHRGISCSVMEHFEVLENPKIFTEKSRKEASRCAAWLRQILAIAGVESETAESVAERTLCD